MGLLAARLVANCYIPWTLLLIYVICSNGHGQSVGMLLRRRRRLFVLAAEVAGQCAKLASISPRYVCV